MSPTSDVTPQNDGDDRLVMTEALVREIATNLRVRPKLIDVLVEKMFGPPLEPGPYGVRVWEAWNRDTAVIVVAKQLSRLWEGLQ